MAWNNRIPRILHLYWGRNKPLSFMRWMTVKSFAELNPDWKIVVHYPDDKPIEYQPWPSGEQKTPTATIEDHFDRLTDVKNVSLQIETRSGCRSEVHRSDLARWSILADIGGVWADLDILFIKPMDAIDLPRDVDVVLSYFKTRNRTDANRVGFLMASDSEEAYKLYHRIYSIALQHLDDLDYQSLGRHILDRYIPSRKSEFDADFHNLPQPVVYPFQPRQLHRMYWTRDLELGASTIGIHWYAGHPDSQLQQAKITERNVAKQPARFYELMTTMLKGQA